MKKYKTRSYLIIMYIIITILIIIFFKIINTTKIWTYKEYSMTTESNKVNILTIKKDIKLFRENNFFYHNNKKYLYEINNITKDKNVVLIELNLNSKIDLKSVTNKNTIFLPEKKKKIISLIIDSWRSKWKH